MKDSKEELRKKFEKFTQPGTGLNLLHEQEIAIFDFFYSEIEQERKTKIDWMNGCADKQKQISRLEALVVAADKVIDSASRRNWLDYVDALDEYNTLKANH